LAENDDTSIISHTAKFAQTTPLAFVVGVGLILVTFARFMGDYLLAQFVTVTGLLVVLGGGAAIAYAYLKGNLSPARGVVRALPEQLPEHLAQLKQAVDELREAASKTGSVVQHIQLSDSEKVTVVKALEEGLAREVAREAAAAVQSNTRADAERMLAFVRQYFAASQMRLQQEVSALTRRSNLNLIVGGFTTLLAVGLLIFIVVARPADPHLTIPELALHYLPRLSIAIFIEIFSFFFLRLYRAGLDEIKFFQNELTNVETKYAALEAALSYRDDGLARRVIGSLARTERNFVLSKGQSTVELERIKAEKTTTRELATLIAAIQGTVTKEPKRGV
jgi:hypothetical protein